MDSVHEPNWCMGENGHLSRNLKVLESPINARGSPTQKPTSMQSVFLKKMGTEPRTLLCP